MDLNYLILIACLGFLTDSNAQTLKNFTFADHLVTAQKHIEKPGDYDQCYVNVVVHNSSSFLYGLQDALVTSITGNILMSSPKPSFFQVKTDSDGFACVPVSCRAETRVFVEKNDVRILAMNKTIQQNNIPPGFLVQFEYASEVLQFWTYVWGNPNGKTGPIYYADGKQQCLSAGSKGNSFVFSYISIPDKLFATAAPSTGLTVTDDNFRYVWNYGIQGSAGIEPTYCYLKIKFTTSSTQINVTTSSFENDEYGLLLGTFSTGPQFNPNLPQTFEKAACIEYRCPINDIMDGTNKDTYLFGSISVPGTDKGCCVRYSQKGTSVFAANSTSFWTKRPLSKTRGYGSNDGIYVNEVKQAARSRCFTGHEFLKGEYSMNPDVGFAFEYDCNTSTPCPSPQIVG